jgi:hypothetical protein
MTELLYKYRSLSNYKRFVDILLRNRLFACSYDKLNDPMEGYFRYSGSSDDYVDGLRNEKQKSVICSLSQTYRDGLMWSFYADEHRGCCFEIEVTSKKDWRRISVNYTNELANVDDKMKGSVTSSVDYILSTKSLSWENEQEIRFVKKLSPKSRVWLNIKIHRILLGIRMTQEDERMIRGLVETINLSHPKRTPIEVVKLKRQDIDFGFKNS